MLPKVSRRQFIQGAAAAAAVWPQLARRRGRPRHLRACFVTASPAAIPLPDRVMLWTRVTSPAGATQVRWRVGTDEKLSNVVASGNAGDVGDARPHGQGGRAGPAAPDAPTTTPSTPTATRSAVGRTRTLPEESVERVRLASVSCSNYPAGYFNVYRCLANRSDLDAVLHLGDYIYEFANGVYGDGADSGRVPMPAGEASTLADYRWRYATYRTDIDLQAAHAAHPFIAVWDDHEIVNDAWRGGAPTHTGQRGRLARRGWARPTRPISNGCRCASPPPPGIRLYRDFRFGRLADLVMLDTRGLRDRQALPRDAAGAQRPGAHAARRRAGGVALRQPSTIAAGGHGVAAPRPADPVRAAGAPRHRAAEHRRVGRLPGGARARVRLRWSRRRSRTSPS